MEMTKQQYTDISKDMRTIMAFLQFKKEDKILKIIREAREKFSPILTETRKNEIMDLLGQAGEHFIRLDTAEARVELKKINQILKTLLEVH